VVAFAGVDRPDEGEAIENRRRFRQMLATRHAGQFRGDGPEGAAFMTLVAEDVLSVLGRTRHTEQNTSSRN